MKDDKPVKDVQTIAAMCRDAEWLDADCCAFRLGMLSRDGSINRRGFLERVATSSSFPKPSLIGNVKRWERVKVDQWAKDEAKIRARAA